MIKYFSLIVTSDRFDTPISDEQLLDTTDTLGSIDCTDCSVMVHRDGLELSFHCEASSLDEALATAVRDARQAQLTVVRVELDQEAIAESLATAS